MTRKLAFPAVLLVAGLIGRAQELPPEAAADKHLVDADRNIRSGLYHIALGEMDEAMALQEQHGVVLPDCLLLEYARRVWSAGLLETAVKSVGRYVSTAGRKGKCYTEALQFLSKSESTIVFLGILQGELDKAITDKKPRVARGTERQIQDLAKKERFQTGIEFLFQQARVAWLEGSIRDTIQALRRYLQFTGEDATFGEDALALLAEAEALTLPIEPEMVTIPAARWWRALLVGLAQQLFRQTRAGPVQRFQVQGAGLAPGVDDHPRHPPDFGTDSVLDRAKRLPSDSDRPVPWCERVGRLE